MLFPFILLLSMYVVAGDPVLDPHPWQSTFNSAGPQPQRQSPVKTKVKVKVKGGEAFPTPEGMSLSYWLQSVRSSPLLDYRSTEELPRYADVVIIGSGLTGSLTAYELLSGPDPPSSVVVLEARELSSGATGRNAGHCTPSLFYSFTTYTELFGVEQAKKLIDHGFATCDKLAEFIQTNNIDCELWAGYTYEIAIDQQQAEEVTKVYNAYKAYLREDDEDHVKVYVNDSAEAEKLTRIKGAKALWGYKALTLHPWKLVAHIIRQSLSKGLNLQTWTPVTSVTPHSSGHGHGLWDVHTTSRGFITTPTVVYATNAYTSGVLPSFAAYIQPEAYMCNRVVPPSTWSGSKALQRSFEVRVAGGWFFGVNPRLGQGGDGNLLFGGISPAQEKMLEYLNGDESGKRLFDDSLSDFGPVAEAIVGLTNETFEGWNDVKHGPGVGLLYGWSGVLSRSADALPFVGSLPNAPGQWIAAGYHGLGMQRVFSVVKGLVTLIRGGTWADTGLPEVLEVTSERLKAAEERPQF